MCKKENIIFIKDVEVPAIVQNKADAAFSKIIKEGTDSMERKKNYNVKKHEKTRYHFKSSAAAAACICILLMGSITAVAAAYHQWSRSMQGNLQASIEQQDELIDSGITTILNDDTSYDSMKVTSGNVTIKPLEVIADGHFVHLSFSVEGYTVGDMVQPDFEYISVYTGNNSTDEDGWVDMSGGSFYDGTVVGIDGKPVYDNGESIKFDENGTLIPHYKAEDGTLEFVMTIFKPRINENLLGQTVHVEFKNLGTVYKAEYENALDGTWSFDIPLPEKNAAELYTLDTELGDSGALVKSVELSPISIKINYDFTGVAYEENGFDSDGKEISSTFFTEPPAFCGVRLNDGTMFPYITSGGMTGYTDESHTEYYSLFAFNRVIETNRIDALLFRKSPPNEESSRIEDNLYIIPFNASSK